LQNSIINLGIPNARALPKTASGLLPVRKVLPCGKEVVSMADDFLIILLMCVTSYLAGYIQALGAKK